MAEDWEEHAEIWDRDEDVREFADQALVSLFEHVDLDRDAWKLRRVLDFGCGTGLLTEKLAPLVREVVAVDISPAMLGVLSKKELGNVVIHWADVDDEAVRAAPWFRDFDLIVASCVCGVLPRYAATLSVLAGALSPGGFFAQWDWLLPDDDDEDEDGLTLDAVASAFDGAGLNAVVVDAAFSSADDAVLLGIATRGTVMAREP